MRKEKLEELKILIQDFQTVNMKKISKPPHFLSTEVYECSLNNGKIITREKIKKEGKDGSAAVIVPLTSDNEIILVVEPRVFSTCTVGVGVPAGYIEPGEDGAIAALRELKEEIGYQPKELLSLGGFYQDLGCSSAFNQIFLAKDCKKVSKQQLDPGEYIKYFSCTFEEAFYLIENNYIQGCNSIIALEKAKQYIKER